jgi:hypothetical protein
VHLDFRPHLLTVLSLRFDCTYSFINKTGDINHQLTEQLLQGTEIARRDAVRTALPILRGPLETRCALCDPAIALYLFMHDRAERDGCDGAVCGGKL